MHQNSPPHVYIINAIYALTFVIAVIGVTHNIIIGVGVGSTIDRVDVCEQVLP